jgi:hypothetical protein
LLIHRPTDVSQGREVRAAYHQHDTQERPCPARPCGNRPPRVAFPTLPKRPPLPAFLDPDGWVQAIDGAYYARKVRGDGGVSLGERSSSVQQPLAGKRVGLEGDGRARELVVWYRQEAIKRMPIKGLQQALLPWEAYVARLREETRPEWRRSQQARATKQSRR